MEKVLHNGNWKKEKGLTLIEAVVALAIITLVSISSASIAVFAVNSIATLRVKSYFSRETTSIANLFMVYDSNTYESALHDLTGYSFSEPDTYENITLKYDSDGKFISSEEYTYKITLSYDKVDENYRLIMGGYRKNDTSPIFDRSVIKYA